MTLPDEATEISSIYSSEDATRWVGSNEDRSTGGATSEKDSRAGITADATGKSSAMTTAVTTPPNPWSVPGFALDDCFAGAV